MLITLCLPLLPNLPMSRLFSARRQLVSVLQSLVPVSTLWASLNWWISFKLSSVWSLGVWKYHWSPCSLWWCRKCWQTIQLRRKVNTQLSFLLTNSDSINFDPGSPLLVGMVLWCPPEKLIRMFELHKLLLKPKIQPPLPVEAFFRIFEPRHVSSHVLW